MITLPAELREALDEALSGHREHDLARSAEQLTARYRQPIRERAIRSAADVAAYAAVRMPATYAAVRTALAEAAGALPGFAPGTHLDVGGGTGAAVWAAADVWPSLATTTVYERDPAIIDLATTLVTGAGHPAVRGATWRQASIRPDLEKPAADLTTLSYVLGELPEDTREAVVRWLAARTKVVAIIEPGTQDGYARIVKARDQLLGMGLHLAAPCPHEQPCPITGDDWCHFAARLPRDGLHRRLKSAALAFEDEKYSYVVATTEPVSTPRARILRHPRTRKGLVTLTLCEEGAIKEDNVSKRHGELYKRARDVEWGESWPGVME
ncbi:small ribosomal subunit Rsm22 family protein [Nonomuraea sp. NBC_01738]|uniref:small ribosomal subunit Rsm22 family protein n=1 Tax=Nonomuraea sp. NBC_01738 TaxID=2976003 RepID=UPI002E10A46A|nr:small ribosomal subunit Rsm22 family protein [Nonomuraea sp. NBC_01738]